MNIFGDQGFAADSTGPGGSGAKEFRIGETDPGSIQNDCENRALRHLKHRLSGRDGLENGHSRMGLLLKRRTAKGLGKYSVVGLRAHSHAHGGEKGTLDRPNSEPNTPGLKRHRAPV